MKYLLSLFFILCVAVGAVFSQPQQPPAALIFKAPVKADLKDYTAEDKSYSITFPGVPKTVKRDMGKAFATVSSVAREGSNSMVTVFEFQNNVEDYKEKAFELLKSSLQTQKVKIEAERDISADGLAAKEFDLLEDLKFSKIRLFVSGNKIFELRHEVWNWGMLNRLFKEKVVDFENETKRFFDSFKILDKPKKETVPLDFLGVTGETTYVNKFFGFALEFPAGWSIENPLGLDEDIKEGIELLKTNQEKLDRTLAEIVKREAIIFGVNNMKAGAATGENFLVAVMKLPAGAGEVEPAVLLKNTRDFFLQNPKFKLGEDVKTVEIKGEKFSTMKFVTTVEGVKIYQSIRLTVRKGYSINFTITCVEENGCKSLEQVFESLKFNTK